MEKIHFQLKVITCLLLTLITVEVCHMAHGQRDWSNIGAEEVVHGLADVGELAARLGSPVTHNREGNVVHIETFEYGVDTWHPTLYGTGAEIIVSAQKARTSGYSCKMIAGSDGTGAAKIFRSFPLPVLGNYGLELSWLPEQYSKWLLWGLDYHDGGYNHQYRALYRVDENDVQVKDENGNYQTVITGLDLSYTYADFHVIKMVVDLVNDEFLRLIINDVEYDLSDHPAYVFAEAAGPDLVAEIVLYGDAGHNGFSYIDDVILTQNEPP